jgi:hypothetical protein
MPKPKQERNESKPRQQQIQDPQLSDLFQGLARIQITFQRAESGRLGSHQERRDPGIFAGTGNIERTTGIVASRPKPQFGN